MSQTRADMVGDAALRSGRTPAERPLSPHTSIWRWHVTMAASILTRISGVGLYAGFLIGAGWAVSLASGEAAYARFQSIIGSPLGLLVMFLLTLGFWYHAAAGVRHLVFDAGRGYHPNIASLSAWAAIAFTIVATVLTWVAAFATGAL